MWLDVVGLLIVGLGTLWGARMGLVRAVTVLVAVIVCRFSPVIGPAVFG